MSATRVLGSLAGVCLLAASVPVEVIVKTSGDRYLNKRNTALAPRFTTVDAGVGYRMNRWELRVDGRNLTNRRDAVSESELGDAQYYRMPARRIDVSVSVPFQVRLKADTTYDRDST